MEKKPFLIIFYLVVAAIGVGFSSLRNVNVPSAAMTHVNSEKIATSPKVVVAGGEASYPVDISDDRNLVGAAHDVFVGKVLSEVSSESWYTKFAVQVIENIKGNLQGTVNVGVTGGYYNDVFYVAKGSTWLAPGSTYLLAVRYRSIDGSYRLIDFDDPVSWKLLSSDSSLSAVQLQSIAGNDSRVKQLEAAYPKEILFAADVYNHNTLNSYISTHTPPPAPPTPPSAPSSTEEINPPVLSNLASAVASTSVTISWTTNKPATSQMVFGSSTAMSAHVPSDSNFSTTHSLQISGLVPGSTYYYEAQSTDPSGKVGNSPQQSFSTTDVTSAPN